MTDQEPRLKRKAGPPPSHAQQPHPHPHPAPLPNTAGKFFVGPDAPPEFPQDWDCNDGTDNTGLTFGPASPAGCRSPKDAAEPYVVNAVQFPLPSKETLSKREQKLLNFATSRKPL
jgi:hypothetical protein